MSATLQELAALVGGTFHGDGALLIIEAQPLSEAGCGAISFLEGDRFLRQLKGCKADAFIMPPGLAARRDELFANFGRPVAVLETSDPLAAFVKLRQFFNGDDGPEPKGVDPRAAIDPTAVIGSDATIGPFAVIGAGSVLGARCRIGAGVVLGRNCRVGDDVVLHPNVVLYDAVKVGHRVIIHGGAVLGSDGFGYRFQDGRHVKVPQFGTVEIGDDVEIGAGSAVDRGTFTATRIGAGTKIDNQVQIGHNVQIGRHNLIVSQVGIAGSCSTGDYVVLAGQVGLADHVHLGDGVQVGAKSGVTHDLAAGERVLGVPSRPESEQKRIMVSLDKLPELRRDVRQIKQHLGLDGSGPLEKAS